MKLNKIFLTNFSNLNYDKPYSKKLFKRRSRIKKFFNRWATIIIIIGMTYLCGKIALEGLSPFMLKMFHQ